MTPIDILLFCPRCLHQHVDQPNAAINWDNPPHRSHLCLFCGYVWRPADVPTNGVSSLLTQSGADQCPHPLGEVPKDGVHQIEGCLVDPERIQKIIEVLDQVRVKPG